MKTACILTVAALLAGGSAVAKKTDDIVELKTPRTTVRASVDAQGLQGPDLRLRMTNDALRGQAFQRPVDLKLSDQRIQGTVGQEPVNLSVRERPGVVEMAGNFAGQPSSLTLSPDELTGSVGPCGYNLIIERDRKHYSGTRACGDQREDNVHLAIPESLGEDSASGRMAALSLLLSHP
ncbi:hypothetical protein D7Y13_32675 [Corallococcus praedator]|uniref:Uncharacterized protein n=1 Tax=Corallococcus praedator TaxID=2316724 RepID=A0ABX9Q9F8_9BACT|nr:MULTISPECIES: hypothetical protein [Corallococcus]RKH11619.1 hypothetical protein D7X74_25205 [Corallococcus sp. CA047B]RKH32758.1 hypothetical protein D7X75_14455 [Corallococcus sp. CA031C]RKH94852.1 hypothetical protein D7Y13_32675 [Corallococcus praedator]